jgi:Acyl-ACP thioesterase
MTKQNCVQEVAGNHGVAMWGRSDMGFATDPIMVEHNLIFVVTRMQMRMDAYPQWCAPGYAPCLTLRTHASNKQAAHALTCVKPAAQAHAVVCTKAEKRQLIM